MDRLRLIAARARPLLTVENVLVAASMLFALVVQSGLFRYSNWMLGDIAYHRGVAYTMQGGFLPGEGPYRGLITYYGGLYSLVGGTVAAWLGATFDQVVSVASWFAGPLWVLAAWVLARRVWRSDRLAVGLFVALATVAVPFSTSAADIWVNSTLASSQNYWPVFPRDIALILMLLVATELLDSRAWRRILASGLLIGVMAALHFQMALVTGGIAAVFIGWGSLRERRPRRVLEIVAIAAIAGVVSAWWWVPRIWPTLVTLQNGGLLLASFPAPPLDLGPTSYIAEMGLVGVLSVLGFALLLSRRFRGPGTTLMLAWAVVLLAGIVMARIAPTSLLPERRAWVLFSIPATAAGAIAAAELVRILPRPAAAVFVGVAALSLLPGTLATFARVSNAYPEGRNAGYETVDTNVWRPLWQELNDRVRSQRGVVLGTYDSYAIWAWSFSGAQPVSAWLPGYDKLGFDPSALTGLGYLDRLQLLESAFTGQQAMCGVFGRLGVTTLLLDGSQGLVATYDLTPAMDYRVDPRARTLASINRQVGNGIVYEDNNSYDFLELKPGASYSIGWIDPAIKRVVVYAELPQTGKPSMIVTAGSAVTQIASTATGAAAYSVETPEGLPGGITVTATSPVRLFRISAYTPVSGIAAPDGPFIADLASLCR